MMQNQQDDIVAAMLDVVREALGANGFPDDVERGVEQRLRREWGGQEVYVKKIDLDIAARSLAIRTKYNMCNRRELQLEYGISRSQFYKILKGS